MQWQSLPFWHEEHPDRELRKLGNIHELDLPQLWLGIEANI